MTVRVKGLTGDNQSELATWEEQLPISELGKTYVVFGTETAQDAHDALDKLMRETIAASEDKGTRSTPYRSLIAVRSKLARGVEDKNVVVEGETPAAATEPEEVVVPEVEEVTKDVVLHEFSVEDGEYAEGALEADLTDFDEAHNLIVQIRNGLADLAESAEEVQTKITLAYHRRAWIVMGYDDWADLVTKEFKSAKKAKLPSADRQELHASMRRNGMSYRAIAEVTGSSPQTVMRDVAVPDGTVVDAEVVALPETITGKDGKERKAKAEKKIPVAKPEQTADEKKLADLQLQVATLAKDIPWNKNQLKMIHGRIVKIANLMGTEV